MTTKAQDLLMARQYAYKSLHVVFGQKPTEALLNALLGKQSMAVLSELATNEDLALEQAITALSDLRDTYCDAADDEALQDLMIEYTRLFVGPHTLQAPPWEMIYKTGKNELFQPGVLELKEIYNREGCTPAEHPHASMDHLGIELDFMRFMCEKTLAALDQGDTLEVERLEKVQSDFLKEHLLEWVPQYLKKLQETAKLPYYPCMGALLLAFLKQEQVLLQQ